MLTPRKVNRLQKIKADEGISRRGFIAIGAVAAAGATVSSTEMADGHISADPAAVVLQSLGGAHWQVADASVGGASVPAEVPGDIFTDLLRAKRIEDPYFRENNATVQWVGKRIWRYSTSFTPDAALFARKHILLRCHGLDTLADIHLNGSLIGRADNMYRTWEFEVGNHLKRGVNNLEIIFHPTAPYAEAQLKKCQHHPLAKWLKPAQCSVRKAPYMWGWDWCRPLLTCGIWKPIELVGFDARITDLRVEQHLPSDKHAVLNVHTAVEGHYHGVQASISLSFNGDHLATHSAIITNGHARTSFQISQPQLWWPNGMGPQNLYTVEVEIRRGGQPAIDRSQRRIGLRTVRYLKGDAKFGQHLEVNGVPLFAKGADWIPPDNIPTRITPAIIRRYVRDARECGFNMLRFWGGGFYEDQSQFDACDESGLLVLFEFKFANHFYPVFDPHWLNNVRHEVREQVRLNRHHPCIAIWSGNNEIYWFHGFNKLFKETIGGILKAELPDANYELGSGDPGSKIDLHYWGPWNVIDPPKPFRQAHGFITEFGMQSFPQPATVNAYTAPDDRKDIYSPVMVYHERSFGKFGMQNMLHEVEQYFGPLPKDFDSTLWLSQIAQAYVMGWGVEHWRRQMPRTTCTLIWQLNDSWPGPTWSMIDWYHRWKAIMFASKRFYAPVLVSTETNLTSGGAAIWLSNDRMDKVSGDVHWQLTDTSGRLLHQGHAAVDVPPHTSEMIHHLPRAEVSAHPGPVLIWTQMQADDETLSSNCHFAVAPKSLGLPNPQLQYHVSQTAHDVFSVDVSAQHPALWVWLNLAGVDARYDDNFFHLHPAHTRRITVTPDRAMSLRDFLHRLTLRSVYDLMSQHGG